MIEVVISPHSKLVGKSVCEVQFRERYNAVVLALHRPGFLVKGPVSKLVLEAGDCLLLRSTNAFASKRRLDRNFTVIRNVDELDTTLKDRRKMVIAVVLVAGMIGTTSSGKVSLLASSLITALLMLLTGCLTVEHAWKALRGNLLMIIASAFALGVALEKTGTAKAIADTMVKIFSGIGDIGILFGLFFATSILTEGLHS